MPEPSAEAAPEAEARARSRACVCLFSFLYGLNSSQACIARCHTSRIRGHCNVCWQTPLKSAWTCRCLAEEPKHRLHPRPSYRGMSAGPTMLKQTQGSTCRALPFPAAAPFMRSMPSGPYWSYSARDCGFESTSAPQHSSQRLSSPRLALLTTEQKTVPPKACSQRARGALST